jgi:hypothetical protein
MPIVQATISSDVLTALISTVNAQAINPNTQAAFTSVSEYITWALQTLSQDALSRYPSSSVTSARSSMASAHTALMAALNPKPTVVGAEFSLTAGTPAYSPSAIGILSSGGTVTTTITVAFINGSYSGTITFSCVPLPGNASSVAAPTNITAAFSPTSRTSAGTTTLTLTITGSGLLTAGVYSYAIVGTDGTGLSNSCQLDLTMS